MKHSALLTLSLSLIILITITCTKDPAGPDISDDLKPKGTITGYIYDMWNRPLKDVLVSVDADSAVPGVSKETGLFTVGKVMEGTYVLRFTHRDYDNDSSYIVTVEQGVNDTLTDTVRLSYAYYILKGRVIYNTSPVPGAGVSAAGYPLSTLTDETGTYVLDKIPKITSLKLICAKSGLGFNTHSSITGIEDDTTRIGDISLIFKGATVSGTVYDTSGAPVRNEIVAAVGGGLIDTTNSDGEYVIENIPCNESSVRIYVLTSDSLFYGATSGINVKDTSIVPNVDIHLRPTSDLENGNGMAIQVFDMVIVDTISAVQLTVYPWTDVHTVIHSFMWSLKGQVSTRNDTTKDAFLSLTKNDLNALAGTVGSRNISISIHARNTEGGLSQKQYFTVMIRTFAPMVSAGGSPTEGGTPQDSVSIEVNETVYFTADIDDPFGGIDTIEWDFGDETGKWYSTDGLANVRHAFPEEGSFLSVLRVKDTDGNEARDTVTVEVKLSQLDPPQNISPPDKDTVWTLTDNVTLLWHKVTSSQTVLYDVYLDSLNDPAGILYKPDVSDTSLLVTVRKDKTYHWKIVAKSGGNTSTGKTWTFTVKSSDTTNHSPSFTDSIGSMTGFATVGKEYKDTLHANDPDGDTLSFSFLESPTGMSLTGSIINWIPTIADVGNKLIKVQVSDGKGGLDSLSWTIFVNDTTGELVAYYPFNGNANDASGNGNHGTENGGVSLTKDRFGDANSAYIFDGVDDDILIANSPSLIFGSSNFTLTAWIYPIEYTGGDGCNAIITKHNGDDCSWLFRVALKDDTAKLNFETPLPIKRFYGNTEIALNTWYHVAVVRLDSIGIFYLNGNPDGSFPIDKNFTTTEPVIISGQVNSNDQKFTGKIDDVRIYNRALTTTEIDSLYHLNGWPTQQPPFFTNTSMTDTATVGEEYKDTLHAEDINGDTLAFLLLESPTGMSLTDSIITWIPAIADTGEKPVQVQVSDGNGGFDSLSWTISVESSPWIPDSLEHNNGMVKIMAKGYGFRMGQPGVADPVHQVRFTYNFFMDTTEVTQGDYSSLMSLIYPGYEDPPWPNGVGDNYPAYSFNWYDAVLYCNARSKSEGLDTVYIFTSITGTPGNGSILSNVVIDYAKIGYRMPTEAEWEYACRAGTKTDYYWGTGNIDNYAWYNVNSNDSAHPVCEKLPNGYGLYDMSGNVNESCNDWFGGYSSDLQEDPVGPSSGSERIIRGGPWGGGASWLRSASRDWAIPEGGAGLRVVLPTQ